MKQITLAVVPVGQLAEELRMPDLPELLRKSRVNTIDYQGEEVVEVEAWLSVVREGLRARLAGPKENAGAEKHPSYPTSSWSSSEAWSDQRRKLFAAHPEVARKLDDFLAYVAIHEPDARFVVNRWTVSIIMPGGRYAGVKPGVMTLVLYATRQARSYETRVASARDYEAGLKWLRDLPNYDRSGASQETWQGPAQDAEK